MVRGYRPDDWDRLFGLVNDIKEGETFNLHKAMYAGWNGAKLYGEYRWKRFGYRNGRYAQIREDDYKI